MAIGVADRLTAKTTEKILASSNEIEFIAGEDGLNGNTVAAELNRIKDRTVYLTEDDFNDRKENGLLLEGYEYNTYEAS